MSAYALFEVTDPDDNYYGSSPPIPVCGHDEGDITWESHDGILWYAGPSTDQQFGWYQESGKYKHCYNGKPGDYVIYINVNGACSAYVQHNDKSGKQFSKKSVHAPGVIRETMTLSAGEALIVHHVY